MVLAAIATFAGTRVLIGNFRHTAEQSEQEATLLADLRSDVAAHSGFLHRRMDTPADAAVPAAMDADASVRAGFAQAIGDSHTAAGQQLLERGFEQWQSTVADAVPLDASIPNALRFAQHQVVAKGTDAAAGLIDQAGAAGRTAIRADLARAANVENAALASLLALGLLVSVLLIRLGRRLSAEVIGPLGILRDSANRLAAGELDHPRSGLGPQWCSDVGQ